jgi:hypothetical protein
MEAEAQDVVVREVFKYLQFSPLILFFSNFKKSNMIMPKIQNDAAINFNVKKLSRKIASIKKNKNSRLPLFGKP